MNVSQVMAYIAERHKAIAGFVAPLAVSYAAKIGWDVDVEVVYALAVSVLTSVSVYFARNQKKG